MMDRGLAYRCCAKYRGCGEWRRGITGKVRDSREKSRTTGWKRERAGHRSARHCSYHVKGDGVEERWVGLRHSVGARLLDQSQDNSDKRGCPYFEL